MFDAQVRAKLETIPRTRAAAVGAELRRLILSGELPLGTKLRQVEISELFGVSTTPVREAFTVLAREGILEQDAHRGVKVILPSQENLQENYEIRMALEPLAAERAATNIGESELEELDVQLRRMKAADGDPQGAEEESERADANRIFHQIVCDAAGRPRVAELTEQLRNSAEVFVRIAVNHPPVSYRKRADREHAAIIKALRAQDGAAAGEKMKVHLQHNYEHISKSLADLAGNDVAANPGS